MALTKEQIALYKELHAEIKEAKKEATDKMKELFNGIAATLNYEAIFELIDMLGGSRVAQSVRLGNRKLHIIFEDKGAADTE